MEKCIEDILPETQFDRVRSHTASNINARIDQQIKNNIQRFEKESDDHVSMKIESLEKEWDIERALETTASTLILSSTLLTLFVNKKWAWLQLIISAFLLQHALQGWCPPLPIFRRLGVRTQSEIDAEKFGLKTLHS